MTGLRVAVAAAAAALAALAAAPPAPAKKAPPRFPRPATTVASGSWAGVHWTLFGGDRRRGGGFAYCVRLAFASPRHRDGGGCAGGAAPERRPPRGAAAGFPYDIGVAATSDCPHFVSVVGPVVGSAREVAIRLASGSTVRVRTLAAPAGLVHGVRFYALRISCRARPTSVVARNGGGKVVAHVGPRFIGWGRWAPSRQRRITPRRAGEGVRT